MPERIIISACLLGEKCRHDGQSKQDEDVISFSSGYDVIAVCPEVWGGLPTPRPPAEIEKGDGHDVLDGNARVLRYQTGEDVTADFLDGCRKVLDTVRAAGVKLAILKERSPSCGVKKIYRNREPVTGKGVAAAALSREGLSLLTEEDIGTEMKARRAGPGTARTEL